MKIIDFVDFYSIEAAKKKPTRKVGYTLSKNGLLAHSSINALDSTKSANDWKLNIWLLARKPKQMIENDR